MPHFQEIAYLNIIVLLRCRCSHSSFVKLRHCLSKASGPVSFSTVPQWYVVVASNHTNNKAGGLCNTFAWAGWFCQPVKPFSWFKLAQCHWKLPWAAQFWRIQYLSESSKFLVQCNDDVLTIGHVKHCRYWYSVLLADLKQHTVLILPCSFLAAFVCLCVLVHIIGTARYLSVFSTHSFWPQLALEQRLAMGTSKSKLVTTNG